MDEQHRVTKPTTILATWIAPRLCAILLRGTHVRVCGPAPTVRSAHWSGPLPQAPWLPYWRERIPGVIAVDRVLGMSVHGHTDQPGRPDWGDAPVKLTGRCSDLTWTHAKAAQIASATSLAGCARRCRASRPLIGASIEASFDGWCVESVRNQQLPTGRVSDVVSLDPRRCSDSPIEGLLRLMQRFPTDGLRLPCHRVPAEISVLADGGTLW